MKRNIDLTENRDFSMIHGVLSLKDIIGNHLKTVFYPWSFGNVFNIILDYNEVFQTGNKKDRIKKKRDSDYKNQTECECCGQDLSKKKWNNHYGLCRECDEALYLEGTTSKKFLNKPWIKV